MAFIAALELLDISTINAFDAPVRWISQLVSLRSLDLFPRSFERYFHHDLLTSTNLTNLDLSTDLGSDDSEDHVCLNVHWQQLKRLSITGVQASFGQNSLSPLQLKSLTSLTFDLMPSDSRDMAYFADIMCQFSSSRPDVCLCVDNRQ